MDEFIGRIAEQKILKQKLESKQSEFVAVYGRRRVGKTLLIRRTYESHFAFQLTALAKTSTAQQQLLNFHLAFDEIKNTPPYDTPPENWLYAFHRLRLYINGLQEAKKVVFFDELPWFDTPHSDFIQALEHFWNSWASARSDIILIVCGSAASWMINNLINNHGGLHNRITDRIHLVPFNLRETELFLKQKNPAIDRYQVIQFYMALGGIPFYLNAIDPAQSAIQNIEKLCFSQDGLLRLEFNNLYPALFSNAERHIIAVRALSTKSKGLTREEIIKLTGLPNGGGTTQVLEELEQSGFIRRYIPFQKKKRNSLYQLVDFYTLFYLKFIEPSNPLDKDQWLHMLDHPSYRAWSGYAYEQICLYHVQDIKQALGISGIQSKTFAWKSNNENQNVQIDLLIDRRDRVINLCEIKFSAQEFTITKAYASDLQRKIKVFKDETATKKAVFLTLITTYGLKENTYLHSLVQQDLNMSIFFD
ncbi:MAG: ATP-binding protein [Bacteroidota bacterium]